MYANSYLMVFCQSPILSVILKTDAADYNVYNKAGYTPVMLTALVEAGGKQDLTPLTRLFKGADLDLQSKKVIRPGSTLQRVCLMSTKGGSLTPTLASGVTRKPVKTNESDNL